MAKAKTVSIYNRLAEITNMLNNPEMVRWAERLDSGEHGWNAGGKNIRQNLMAVAREAKLLRSEITDRKNALKKAKGK